MNLKNPVAPKTNPARKNNQPPTKRSTTTTLQDSSAPPPPLIRKNRVFGTNRCPNIPSMLTTVDKPTTKPKIPPKKFIETGAARSKLESETNNNRRKDREKITAPILRRKNPASLVRVVKVVTQSEDGPSTPTGPPLCPRTVQKSQPERETINSSLSKDEEKLSDLDQLVKETSSIDGPPLCPPMVLSSQPESETNNNLSKEKLADFDQVVKETTSIDGPPLCPPTVLSYQPESETNNNLSKDKEKLGDFNQVVKETTSIDGPPLCPPTVQRSQPGSESINSNQSKVEEKLSDLDQIVKETSSIDGPPLCPPTVLSYQPESETNNNLSKDKEKLADFNQVVKETTSIDGPPLCPPTVLSSQPESETNNNLNKDKEKLAEFNQVVKEIPSIDGPTTPSGPPLCPTMVGSQPEPQTNNILTKDKEKISAPLVRKKPASSDRVVKVTCFEDGPTTPTERPLCPTTTKAPRVRVEGTPTPFHTARDYRKTRFEDELETASYWLAHIRTAEAVGKHSVSASFFRLAAECKAEPKGGLRAELKRYMIRHQHLRSEVEWNLTCQTYGLITVKNEGGVS